jgi:phosphoserine phosphatase
MPRKKTPTELEKAEVKLSSLLDKRDQFNEEANAIRQERDLLHEQRRETADKMRDFKGRRDSFVKEMRAHKQKRNSLHNHASDLIELKRKMRGNVNVRIVGDLRQLRRNFDEMEMKQQTTPLTIAKENALIDDIRKTYRELKDLEKIEDENVKTTRNVGEINEQIDDLFKAADEEHKLVVELSNKAQEMHEKVVEAFSAVTTLTAEANKKHKDFLELREKANAYHERAQEMRRTVLKTKEDERRERREAKDIIRQQNLSVRKALTDKKKLDEVADEQLQRLLKHGKVELKG